MSGHLGVVVGIEVGQRIIVEKDVLCKKIVALIDACSRFDETRDDWWNRREERITIDIT